MDVNNSVSASTHNVSRTFSGSNYSGASNATAAPATERTVERPRTAERAERPSSFGNAAGASEATGFFVAHAPRLSELGPRVQRDEDVTESMLDKAFEDANRILQGGVFSLSYSIHEDTGRVMVRVNDVETGEVIREIPPESRLDIYARITEFTGLLFDQGS